MKRKHPNFIDIALILILVTVAGAAYLLSHTDSEAVAATPRCYTVEVAEADPARAEAIHVGATVTDKIRGLAIGTVTAVEAVPSTAAVLDETQGKYVQAEIPGKVNLYITVQADTYDTGLQITTDSGYVLQVGNPISCAMDDYYAVGKIVVLDR